MERSHRIVFTVYVLENPQGRFYIGYTSKQIEERLDEHNQGNSRWTRNKGPWQVRYIKNTLTRGKALWLERKLKSYKGGRAFQKLFEENSSRGEVA